MTPDPLLGQILDGKYQIEERLGAGGMGTVYKAVHVTLGAPRAIKVMRRELVEDDAFVQRFQNEARLAEGLRHPNLVSLYDFTRLPDGTWFIVCEYVEGDSLGSLVKRGVRYPSSDVAHLLGEICDGLALAHRKGIIHRDISPDNIMITRGEGGEPTAKLLDFGIAKDVGDSSAGQTGSTVLLGKVGYASPEQLGMLPRGETIDARTDVFSLATVAYQMLRGSLPWRKDSLQSYVHDLLVQPEDDLHQQLRQVLPAPWLPVLMKALARHRDVRTPTMQALKADMLEAARRVADDDLGLPQTRTVAESLDPREPTWRKGVRVQPSASGGWRLGMAAAATFVALAGIYGLAQAIRARPAAEPAKPGPVAAAAATPAAKPDDHPSRPEETARDAETVPSPSRRGDGLGIDARAAPPSTLRTPAATEPVPTPKPAARATPAATAAPTAPPAPAHTPPPELGTLVLRSTPAATVLVDGQSRGRTPLTLSDLPDGPHSLVLSTDDGRRLEDTVKVTAGATTAKDVRFPGFGSLSVTSDIWFEVSIDGGPTQQTPCRIDRLMAGAHRVTAARDGYREATYEVEIKEGETHRLNVALERR